jgi:hypothetical protein
MGLGATSEARRPRVENVDVRQTAGSSPRATVAKRSISNRHLPIRNEAISLKTRLETFSNRHGCGRSQLPDRRSFFGVFWAESAACPSRAAIEGAAHDR